MIGSPYPWSFLHDFTNFTALLRTPQQPTNVFQTFLEPFSQEATRAQWAVRSEPVSRQVSVNPFPFSYHTGRESGRNTQFADENNFMLVDFRRIMRRKAPKLLVDLLDDYHGGVPVSQLPLALVSGLMQITMASQPGMRLSYSELREITRKYKLGEMRIGWGYADTDGRALATLESHSWNDMQLHVESKSIYRDYSSAQLHWHYPQLATVTRILRTVHVDVANPGVVMWYESHPSTESYSASKKYSARWGKFLKMLRRKFGFRFSDEAIDEVANWVGDNLKAPVYRFEEVSGDAIVHTYREEYFGSCMHESSSVYFYAEQPNVKMLRMFDEDGKRLIGRALIWSARTRNGEPVTILDRIYPSDGGPHIRAAQRYAADKGWVYKLEQSIDGPLSRRGLFYVDVVDCEYYPYMDTFAYAKKAPSRGDKNFVLSNDQDDYVADPWHATGNYNPWTGEEDTFRCENCEEETHEDDLMTDPHSGEHLCASCFEARYAWSDSETAYINLNEAVEVENVRLGWNPWVPEDASYVVYSEPDGVYYATEHIGDLRINDTVIELTGGEWKGEWTVESNVTMLMGLIIHNNDPKFGFYELGDKERQPLL